MRILVISDTHGDFNSLLKAVDSQPKAEVIIHCGDGEEQSEFLKERFKEKMIVAVKGNCDWDSLLPAKEILRINGKTIFVTHGHLYGAKAGLYNLVCAAREEKADILLFGHTHIPITEYDNGLYIMNPGSCHGYNASYGFIDILDDGSVVTNTVQIRWYSHIITKLSIYSIIVFYIYFLTKTQTSDSLTPSLVFWFLSI